MRIKDRAYVSLRMPGDGCNLRNPRATQRNAGNCRPARVIKVESKQASAVTGLTERATKAVFAAFVILAIVALLGSVLAALHLYSEDHTSSP